MPFVSNEFLKKSIDNFKICFNFTWFHIHLVSYPPYCGRAEPSRIFFKYSSETVGCGKLKLCDFQYCITQTFKKFLITWDLWRCCHGNIISKKRSAKKRRKIMVFVSHCPKSSPKLLFEPKIKISITILNPCVKFELNPLRNSYRKAYL